MAAETRNVTTSAALPTPPKSARTLDAEEALRRLSDPAAKAQLQSIRDGARQGQQQNVQQAVEQARKQLTGLMKAMGSAMMTGDPGIAAWLGREAGRLAKGLGETIKGYAEQAGNATGADRATITRELSDLRDAAKQVFTGTRQIANAAKSIVEREDERARGAQQRRKDVGKGLSDVGGGEATALGAIESALAKLRQASASGPGGATGGTASAISFSV
jgi:hypothetical protein